ncbi:MAG: hypothetical protein ACJATP_000478 [Candidatus Azotimanducaceae bacterium]
MRNSNFKPHLARLEGQKAITALIQHFPKIKPASRGYEQQGTSEFRGMINFWVGIG